MGDNNIKIIPPKFSVGDIITINPMSSDFVEGAAYIQINSMVKSEIDAAKRNSDMISQKHLDRWNPKHSNRYQVLDVFVNPYYVRESEEFSGKDGYLLYVKSLSLGVPNRKFLLPDWACMRIEGGV